MLDLLAQRPHPGAVLHWFLGDTDQVQRAVEMDLYFSVNAAMPDQVLQAIPQDRLLTETDLPASTRSTRASRPGDLRHLESRLAMLHNRTNSDIRRRLWQNFRAIATRARVLDHLPDRVFDVVIEA